ncbi:hypothetical protein BH09GEM1_BH09GEM1_28500 [soil metagenome]
MRSPLATAPSFRVRLNRLSGTTAKAWWLKKRDGSTRSIGTFAKVGEREFVSPNPCEPINWVLGLDDVARQFPMPGAR